MARVAVALSYRTRSDDLEQAGDRAHRETHAEGRLQAMPKAEASVVANNNAAEPSSAVNTFAEGR